MAILKVVGCLVAAAVVLSGCAIPMPIKIASWAIDGISYLATRKTVADHGISAALGQDCALIRLVTQKGSVCSDNASSATALAKAEKPLNQGKNQEKEEISRPPSDGVWMAALVDQHDPPRAADPSEKSAAELAQFDTAAGGDEAAAEMEKNAPLPGLNPVPLATNLPTLPEDAGLLSLWLGETADGPSIVAARALRLAGPEGEKAEQMAALEMSPEAAERPLMDASGLPEGREIVARWENMGTHLDGEEYLAEKDPAAEKDPIEELALAPGARRSAGIAPGAQGQTSFQVTEPPRSLAHVKERPGSLEVEIAEFRGRFGETGPLAPMRAGVGQGDRWAGGRRALHGLFVGRRTPLSSGAPPGGRLAETNAIFSPVRLHIRAAPRIGWDRSLFPGSYSAGAGPPRGDAERFALATGPPVSGD